MIDPKTIAVVCMTHYPAWYRGRMRSIRHTDKIRGDLALEFLAKACGAGFSVVVVDGKSAPTFQKSLKTIGGIILLKRRSAARVPARRKLFRKAFSLPGVTVVLMSEAEKVSLVPDGIMSVATPIIEGRADIVVANREPALFAKHYPPYQYESEMEGNVIYNEQLRLNGLWPPSAQNLDVFFGPRAFRNMPVIRRFFRQRFRYRIGKHTLDHTPFDAEEITNANFFPMILALKKGLRVTSVTVPFVYPKLQRQNEEIGEPEFFMEKRRNQRLSIILELMHFLKD